MCLVVMYGVKKEVDANLVEKMLYMNYDVKPLLNEYSITGDGVEDYNFYSCGVCNCDSYMSELSGGKFNNFHELYSSKKENAIARRNAVLELRANPKYDKLTKKFKKEYEKQRQEMKKYSINDTKHMTSYQKFLKDNAVYVDDMLGNASGDAILKDADMDISKATADIVEKYERDSSIIDGVLTLSDDIIIVPVWTDGNTEYKVSIENMYYKDIDENVFGRLPVNHGLKICDK